MILVDGSIADEIKTKYDDPLRAHDAPKWPLSKTHSWTYCETSLKLHVS